MECSVPFVEIVLVTYLLVDRHGYAFELMFEFITMISF